MQLRRTSAIAAIAVDAKVDLVGRRADGSLFLYSNNGNGRWGAAKQIGSDWNDVALFA